MNFRFHVDPDISLRKYDQAYDLAQQATRCGHPADLREPPVIDSKLMQQTDRQDCVQSIAGPGKSRKQFLNRLDTIH